MPQRHAIEGFIRQTHREKQVWTGQAWISLREAIAKQIITPEDCGTRLGHICDECSKRNYTFDSEEDPHGDFRVELWQCDHFYAIYDDETITIIESKSEAIHAYEIATEFWLGYSCHIDAFTN